MQVIFLLFFANIFVPQTPHIFSKERRERAQTGKRASAILQVLFQHINGAEIGAICEEEEEEMDKKEAEKRQRGQFFTVVNPFAMPLFFKWFDIIPQEKRGDIIEPFAGANNIVAMVDALSEGGIHWHCFDIAPDNKHSASPENFICGVDTIENFPKNCGDVVITNPPYLAKNSAKRRGLVYKYPEYDDLYKKCLDVVLKNVGYAAAIIPESFITSGLFHDRIFAICSLPCKMFADTDCPVCLAMFIPKDKKGEAGLSENDFFISRDGVDIQTFLSVEEKMETLKGAEQHDWTMNDKDGEIGIVCIDSTKTASIRFIQGKEIPPEKIKVSSRSLTRVSGLPEGIELSAFLQKCNEILEDMRYKTGDVLLTSFKGLRADGKYRRRLDFKTAQMVMNLAVKEIQEEEGKRHED